MLSNSLEVVGLSDVGKVRSYNEDSLIADAENGIVAVADGMGGHRAGEVASHTATSVVAEGLKQKVPKFRPNVEEDSPLYAIKQALRRANRSIFEAAKSKRIYQGMGTTIAVALFFNNRITFSCIPSAPITRFRL